MKNRSFFLASALLVTMTACDGGNVLAEAEAKSKAACECKDADCVRPHIKWFNEQSLKDGGKALEGLSAEDAVKFTELSVAAGECQMKIKTGAAE